MKAEQNGITSSSCSGFCFSTAFSSELPLVLEKLLLWDQLGTTEAFL